MKGLEYLSEVRELPKKKKEDRVIEPAKTDRAKYQNYLTHHSDDSSSEAKQPWSKILSSSQDKESKAIRIQFESQKKEEELKRK